MKRQIKNLPFLSAKNYYIREMLKYKHNQELREQLEDE